ncbi:AraC family transcriptional regulator, partial [Mycobacterium kansasii]
MEAWKNAPQALGPQAGVVGRAGIASPFDLRRQAPSQAAAKFVE